MRVHLISNDIQSWPNVVNVTICSRVLTCMSLVNTHARYNPGIAYGVNKCMGIFMVSIYLPNTLTSMVAAPVFPTASVTEQVWLPESVERRTDRVTVASVLPRRKQSPVHVDVHSYIAGS